MAKRKLPKYTKNQILKKIRAKRLPKYYDREWLDKRFPGKKYISVEDVMDIRAKYFTTDCYGKIEEGAIDRWDAKLYALSLIAPYPLADKLYDIPKYVVTEYNPARSEAQIARAMIRKYKEGKEYRLDH